jgi:hypothetical protein
MSHEFVVLIDNSLYTYDKYENIPLEFDNLIKFFPEIPEGPHTLEQHEEIEQWNDRLKDLLKRERR